MQTKQFADRSFVLHDEYACAHPRPRTNMSIGCHSLATLSGFNERMLHVSPSADHPADEADKKKKKDKVRSAWISFVGRIVAQIIGAAASIVFGVLILHKYQSG